MEKDIFVSVFSSNLQIPRIPLRDEQSNDKSEWGDGVVEECWEIELSTLELI